MSAQHLTDAGRTDSVIAPLLPLALLSSVRMHDRPREILQDEDLASSLPRRLGLTEVIETRIRQYEAALRRGRDVALEEVADLLRLILRRPDAELILRDAGTWIAQWYFDRRPGRAAIGVLPRFLRMALLRRSVRRMLARITRAGSVVLSDWPRVTRIQPPLEAVAAAGGSACVLYTAALEEIIYLYTRNRPVIEHTQCAGRGMPSCEWTLGG